jgi:hypothetical protein
MMKASVLGFIPVIPMMLLIGAVEARDDGRYMQSPLKPCVLVRLIVGPTKPDLVVSRSWDSEGAGMGHVMLPGRKQRMEVPRALFTGQTIVLPTRFGSVITASSETSIHSLSMRTR